ncbi:MBL fold metallo-hydrolase [Haloactinomyces albus]|uniref:Ribonuclease BN (tRNA processing enzyme) n=1 Tax=Haloactinomyces albus TaxID=1352928 RepID=A0AAE4CMM8_9ACTN|nr:MBL fold metallo-hydrolase [Haloactinomyces albus]MDR7303565.1 ribonuclease BN (tRNA processing enzyme) [Haloactinomyces albus]
MIRVDGATYVVDCGMGSIRNYRSAAAWEQLQAVFLTHLHSDHIYDLGAYLVTGWQVPGESFAQPINVIGPGAPEKIPAEDHSHAEQLHKACANRPLCGTEDVVGSLLQSVYGPDVIVRIGDEGRAAPEDWIHAHDIRLPEAIPADPVENRHPPMDPFEIYTDNRVRVRATLVNHRLCYPSYGFRFDTEYGSVMISGDTAVSENLVRLASGAELLVHEVIDIDAMLATLPPGPTRDGIEVHLRESHTTHTEVGGIAAKADVGELVLSHIVPSHVDAVDADRLVGAARELFDGDVRVATDLDAFSVHPRTRTK